MDRDSQWNQCLILTLSLPSGAYVPWHDDASKARDLLQFAYGYENHAYAGDDDWKAEKCVSSGHSLDQIYSIDRSKISKWPAEDATCLLGFFDA